MENALVKEKTQQVSLELPMEILRHAEDYRLMDGSTLVENIIEAMHLLREKKLEQGYKMLAQEMQAQYEAAPDETLDEVLMYTQW